ncbi:MAG TPA: hypothetical protein VHQ64_13655 [Pyrinomonadaceae bacterium]|jgi:hypothetical protein|nr:hypothetical protein [Pyrinomonadaceae bacterium]
MRRFNSIVYAVLGVFAIIYGVANLFFPAMLVKQAAFDFPLSHILREQAALAIFLGCMSLWCIFNHERRRAVHYFLIMVTTLFAWIHWFDYLTGHLNWRAPLYNTAPVILLLAMMPARGKHTAS